MSSWQSHLKGDPIPWLLETDNPSIRYYTLRELLDRPALDPEVLHARGQIHHSPTVKKILDSQQPGGYWGKPGDFYIRSKYRGTVWTALLLAELGADTGEPRVQQTTKFLLDFAQDYQSHGFAYQSEDYQGGDHASVIPCLTGNMLYLMVRMGCLSDPRVQGAVQWIVDYQRLDDGDCPAPRGWPYQNREKCWGRHTCHMAVVKTLKALAEIPSDQRSSEVCTFIDMAVEFLLHHRIYYSSHNPAKIAMQSWLQFGFPLMWNTDALEITYILSRLGCHDPRMQAAVDLIESKQDHLGRWILETCWNDRTLVNLEREGNPSKWLTLHALVVLRTYYG